MIGNLRKRVEIYARQSVADGRGGASQTLTLWGRPWAEIRLMSPRQITDFGRRATQRQYRVVIRYRPHFPPQGRLVWGSRHFNIIAADDPDNRGERLHLICEEITP